LDPELLKAVVDVNAVAEELDIGVVPVGALMMAFTTEIRPDYALGPAIIALSIFISPSGVLST
jgi:hypothetical protein